MTTTIMTRATARVTEPASNPEYACDRCGTFHTGACPAAAHHQLGDLLARMAREADARIPDGRRARRTLQEMAPGYTRQPVLTLHRPVMANDACPLCGRWSCTGSDCPPASAVPAPATRHTVPYPQGQQPCGSCGGAGGRVVDTSSDGVTRQSWQTCGSCGGSGVAR
ncbi:hypothetical protein [Streptomyces calvus]